MSEKTTTAAKEPSPEAVALAEQIAPLGSRKSAANKIEAYTQAAVETERQARRNAERVTTDALAKRDQAEADRDAARAERDALKDRVAELKKQYGLEEKRSERWGEKLDAANARVQRLENLIIRALKWGLTGSDGYDARSAIEVGKEMRAALAPAPEGRTS